MKIIKIILMTTGLIACGAGQTQQESNREVSTSTVQDNKLSESEQEELLQDMDALIAKYPALQEQKDELDRKHEEKMAAIKADLDRGQLALTGERSPYCVATCNDEYIYCLEVHNRLSIFFAIGTFGISEYAARSSYWDERMCTLDYNKCLQACDPIYVDPTPPGATEAPE